jgi:transposase
MQDFHLTAQQIAALRVLHKKQRDRKKADRVKAIVLLGSGWSVDQVAQALLIDETTVRNWYATYKNGGTDELLTLHYEGKAPSLSEHQACEYQWCGEHRIVGNGYGFFQEDQQGVVIAVVL